MTAKQHSSVMDVLDWLTDAKERRILQRSFTHPVVRCYQRDDFKYYESGRSVVISGELMATRNPERIIYRRSSLVWEQDGKPLTSIERERVFQAVGDHLNERKITWAFSDADPT